jgi:hypothetical protein
MGYEAELEAGRHGHQVLRLLLTLLGSAALIVGAFLHWVTFRTGDKLTIKALVQTDFGARSDLVKTVGGLSILIALVALVGLVDRTGWMTRLAGAAAVVVFVMFAIEAYRSYGDDFNTAVNHLRPGAWMLLGGGVVMLLGGIFGSAAVHRVPMSSEHHGYRENDPTVIREPLPARGRRSGGSAPED